MAQRLRESNAKKATKQLDLTKQKLPTERRKPSKKEQKRLDDNLANAAKDGNNRETKRLLEAGADVNAREGSETALMMAAGHGHAKACLLLLENGADVGAKNSMGWTALHWAAFSDAQICAALLEKGARIDETDSHGKTALIYAKSHNNAETAGFLRLYSIRKMLGKDADRFIYVFNECIQ